MARPSTRTLAAGAVAALGLGAVGLAAPAQAHGAQQRGGTLTLTRSAATVLDRYGVELDHGSRGRHVRAAQHSCFGGSGGTLTFDGDRADTTWSRIRVDERTGRVTATVDGERTVVLKFRHGLHADRSAHHGRGATLLRLTGAGAASIDKAAGGDAFDAGDAFARKAGRQHR